MTSANASRPMTILFQAPNHIGLGHISRLSAIALAIREAMPDAQIPFVVSGSSHSLLESLKIPCIPVPDVRQSWNTDNPLIGALVGTILDQTKPNVLVFDCFPLRLLAYAAIARRIPLVLCLRKMKDFAFYCSEYGLPEDALRKIIVPHSAEEVDLPEGLRRKAIFVGTILRRTKIQSTPVPEEGRSQVVICGGGGGHPSQLRFYNTVLQAITEVRACRRLDATLVTGPLFQRWTELQLINGLRIIPFEPNLPSLLATADLIICQAGYNTLAEVTALGVPTICTPLEAVFDDQFERARQLNTVQPNLEVFSLSDSRELAKRIMASLDRPSHKQIPDEITSPGAALAANVIMEVATEPREGERFRRHKSVQSHARGLERFASNDDGPRLVRLARRAYRRTVPLEIRLHLHILLLKLMRRHAL